MDSSLEPMSESLAPGVEFLLDNLSQLFFWPVVVCVLLLFCFALFSLGEILVDIVQRIWSGRAVQTLKIGSDASVESVELEILRRLEWLRLCSRVAPMLGLVATMIPLGPALVAVSSGGNASQTQSLGHSFSVVILALISASITFCIYTIRRRWLMAELTRWLNSAANDAGESR